MTPLLRRGLALMAVSPLWMGLAVLLGRNGPMHLGDGMVSVIAVATLFGLCVACFAVGAILCLVALMRAHREEEPIGDGVVASALVFMGAYQLVRLVGLVGQPAAPVAAPAPIQPVRGTGGIAFGGLILAVGVLVAAIAAIRRVRRLVE